MTYISSTFISIPDKSSNTFFICIGFQQISKQETPAYEVISGAAIAFAALLLIVPGFATDILGFLLIFPITRKLFFSKFLKKFKSKKTSKKNFIEGEFEDIDDDNDRKI